MSGARRRMIVVTVAIAAALTAVAVVWVLPAALTLHPRLDGAARYRAISDTRSSLVALSALVGTLVGSAFGLRYTVLTFRSSRADRLVDTFQRAIEQLGHETRSVRLGGIHLLRRLTDADPGYGREAIDILAAYLRDRTPWLPVPAVRRQLSGSRPAPASPAETDILAAVEALRTMMRRNIRTSVDLRNCDLAGARLEGMRLIDARLTDSNLTGAYLNDADLNGADLRGAVLTGIHVLDTNFADARITAHWRRGLDLSHAKGVKQIQWC
jgi:hypothetical protein